MALENSALFKFYRRYRWTAEDFTDWQTGMVELGRGNFEGLYGGAVMAGAIPVPATGSLGVSVSQLIASGPTGNLLVKNSVSSLSFDAPTGAFPAKSLVVARPLLINDTYITRPTNPFDLVPLKELQGCEVVKIDGTPSASPQYPSTEPNDVVLFGLNLVPGAVDFDLPDFDFEVRDVPGKNSDFHQHTSKYDDRARAYQVDNQVMGVKPSQTGIGHPKVFLYVNKGIPSNFPQDGSFKFVDGDTFLNFQTGVISGADQQSPNFTPVIPSAGMCIPVTISLMADDKLQVAYGTEGTFAECYDGIVNKRIIDPGAISLPRNGLRLAFVIVKSQNGTTVSDFGFFDARSTFYFGGLDPTAIVTENLSQQSIEVESDTTLFNPNLTIQGGHTYEVKDRATILSYDLITIQPGGALVVDPGGLVRII